MTMHWYVIIARMTTSLLPDFRLDGKVALVTGASSGIGSRLAEGFAAAGATVVLAARREDRLQELAERIRARGGRAATVALDVTDPAAITAAFEQISISEGVVDVLVNNAGIAEPALFLKTSAKDSFLKLFLMFSTPMK
jgi:NADP-dependent 3-hydroxy acid dehydrogenase YdfG